MIWHTIEKLPRYEINALGNVRNKKTHRILIPVKRKDGYFQLKLTTSNTEFKMMLLHRLIAEQFIANPSGNPIINHKNGSRDDNRLENLEWSTFGGNMKHAFRVIKTKSCVGTKNPRSLLKESDVLAIRGFEDRPSIRRVLSKKYGIAESTVNNIMKKRTWKHI